MENYIVESENLQAQEGIALFLQKYLGGEIPIIVCIGTDAVIGDSLGPICGTLLINEPTNAIVYGSLAQPITAKEVPHLATFLNETHPYSKILCIDAAVGDGEDLGLIKMFSSGINPGLGANKKLPKIGDLSIISIVAKKQNGNAQFFQNNRIGKIYNSAQIIAKGIISYVENATKLKKIG